jgi:hypothetical protein
MTLNAEGQEHPASTAGGSVENSLTVGGTTATQSSAVLDRAVTVQSTNVNLDKLVEVTVAWDNLCQG